MMCNVHGSSNSKTCEAQGGRKYLQQRTHHSTINQVAPIKMASEERSFGLTELGVRNASERAAELMEALHECAAFAASSGAHSSRAGVSDRASILNNKVNLLAREILDVGRRYAIAPNALPSAASDSTFQAQLLTQIPTVLTTKLLPNQQHELYSAFEHAHSAHGGFPSPSSEAATSAADSALNALPKQRRSRRPRRPSAPSPSNVTELEGRQPFERLLASVRLGDSIAMSHSTQDQA
jgi:hypothetical protein